ncbi:MAG: hypothetical protein ABJJ53_10975 [Sulfitobacter sp.]
MKFAAIFIFSAIGFVTPVTAQQILVRSGDHSDFSRLAISLPKSQEWESQQVGEDIEFSLPGFTGSINIDSVFTRMQRDRISDIIVKDDRLVLTLNCDCNVSAFQEGQLLVVDVSDANHQAQGKVITQTKKRSLEHNVLPTRNSVALPWIGANSPFAANSLDITSEFEKKPQIDAGNGLPVQAGILQQTQQSLAEEIASAASIGLLESNTPILPSAPELSNLPARSPDIPPKPLPEAIEMSAGNIRLTNSMEMNPADVAPHFQTAATAQICPVEELFAIDRWGDSSGFSAQMGTARDALVDARDRLDDEAVKHLAQLYIYFGFGAEANETLRTSEFAQHAHPHLGVVAEILEHGSISGPNTLSQYTDCESDVALWASLSHASIPSGTSINTDAALRALNNLPKHLRIILAPELSDRFLQYGDAQPAAAAMRSIERLPNKQEPNALLAQADLKIESGSSAEKLLEDLAESNTAESPEALIKLVEGKLARNEPLSQELADLVEAYSQEMRGTQIGNQLKQTQIIALSQSLQFIEAFTLLASLRASADKETYNRLNQAIIRQLSEKAEDVKFLEIAFSLQDSDVKAISTSTNLILSKRLLDLGFASKAQEILSHIGNAPQLEERQLLTARAALALHQPFQAQAALLSISGSEAQHLMAEAKEMAGSYREASEMFVASNSTEAATQAAWLSEDWRELVPPDDNRLGAITTLAEDYFAPTEEVLGPLAQANLALEESNKARNTLKNLLEDPSMQLTPEQQ